MAYPVTPLGEPPFYVEMGASDSTGATLQATFVSHGDTVLLQPVDIGRTKMETGLIETLIPAHSTINNPQMRVLIHPETV